MPGGVDSKTRVWWMAGSGVNVIGVVPDSRWELDPDPTGSNDSTALRVRHGGFIICAEGFDASFFFVSEAEAGAMDPQQRLLLERGYEALHAAGLNRLALDCSASGVFLAIASHDFAEVLRSSPAGRSVYAATGSSHSIAAGRLSFVLGLQGACVSFDTACSAALAAGHGALRSVQLRECETALLEAVNLMLLPGVGQGFALAGMTSARGRCHTFDRRADGYARSEACGGLVLRPAGTASALLGSAGRQDGRSASLTAPNGLAQRALLRAALADAGVGAPDVARLEAHGTGTPLGDPIEAGSLAGAVLLARADGTCGALAAGSVKANSGHAEPAAGLVGLVVLAAGLATRRATPNAQLRLLNPLVGAAVGGAGGACVLPTALADLAGGGVGGVSSFGYSGTIAHALLRGDGGAVVSSLVPVVFRRRAFAWAAPGVAAPGSSLSALALYSTGWALLPTPRTTLLRRMLLISPSLLSTRLLRVDNLLMQHMPTADVVALAAGRAASAELDGACTAARLAQQMAGSRSYAVPKLLLLTHSAQAASPLVPRVAASAAHGSSAAGNGAKHSPGSAAVPHSQPHGHAEVSQR